MNLKEYFLAKAKKIKGSLSEGRNRVREQITNETIYLETVEEIKSAIKLHGDTETGLVQRSSGYLGNNLFAMQDIGIKRGNQEDAILLDTHKDISNFSIMAVADRNGRRRKRRKGK